jgi:hypothetical protein
MTDTDDNPRSPITGKRYKGDAMNNHKVVAFLQCQWFKNPEHVRRIYAAHAGDMDRRASLNARFLFYKSPTGKRLMDAFGGLCDSIVWEEVSPQIAGESSGCFPADLDHMMKVLMHHKPDIVLAFGRLAREAMASYGYEFELICGPHPAARHATVAVELRAMAERLLAIKSLPI